MTKLIQKLARSNEFIVFGVLVALSMVIQVRSGQFFTANNLVDIANAMVVPGLFAVGAFLVIVSGGIDVSFPALASLAVYATTRLLVDSGFSGGILIPFAIAMVLGAVLGAFNGLFTSRLAVPTLIITLGTANVFSGVMQGALGSVQIPKIPASMEAISARLALLRPASLRATPNDHASRASSAAASRSDRRSMPRSVWAVSQASFQISNSSSVALGMPEVRRFDSAIAAS